MKQLKTLSNEDFEFIGVGGDRMKAEGLKKSYCNVDTFVDKPFLPHRSFKHKNAEQPIYPPLLYYKHKNRQALKEMNKNNFFADVSSKRPDLFLTLGNEYLMIKLYLTFAEIYKVHDEVKPPMLHYDKLVINQKLRYTDYLDHLFYTIPLEPENWQYYKFPSTFVGNWAVGRSLEWLYRNSDKYKNMVKDDSILVSKEFNSQIIEELVSNQRVKFREASKLDDSVNVFYACPGNTVEEIKWAIPLVYGSVMEFMKKLAKPLSKSPRALESESFALVITSTPEHEKLITDLIGKHQWPCKLILTKTVDEKYSALCGSDMGIVVNGDAVAEAATFQVPTVIVDPLSFGQTYCTYLYNSWRNDLNIAKNGEVYPELLNGRANPLKVAEILEEFFVNPKMKYKYVERYEKLISTLIPQARDQLKDRTQSTQLTVDNIVFDECYFSESLMASKMLTAKETYAKYKKGVRRPEIPAARKDIFTSLNPESTV